METASTVNMRHIHLRDIDMRFPCIRTYAGYGRRVDTGSKLTAQSDQVIQRYEQRKEGRRFGTTEDITVVQVAERSERQACSDTYQKVEVAHDTTRKNLADPQHRCMKNAASLGLKLSTTFVDRMKKNFVLAIHQGLAT